MARPRCNACAATRSPSTCPGPARPSTCPPARPGCRSYGSADMSETSSRGPLFPPRPLEPPPAPKLVEDPPSKPADPPAEPSVNLALARQIESKVMEVFAERYGQLNMPFLQARDL